MITPEEDACLASFAQLALSTMETVRNSFALARDVMVRGIPGDLVECGVFAGAQVAAMAFASTRRVHLYDSFQGIPEAGPEDDPEFANLVGRRHGDGPTKSRGVSACSRAQVESFLRGWGFPDERFVYHEGWFADTVPVDKPERIAVLRLDGDLYESTLVCLEHLYRLVSAGGYVIVDDYALGGCRRAMQKYFGARMPAVMPVEGGLGPVFWEVLR